MARIRTIKPEFPQSGSTGRISRDARLLFILLWTLADDAGRLRGDSRMLARTLYPYDDGEDGNFKTSRADVEGWMAELESESCICRYEHDGEQYVEIRNWLKHQKIDKPSKSKLPGPEDAESRSLSNPREDSSADRDHGRDQGKDQGRDLPLSNSASPNSTAVPREADDRDANPEPDDTGQVVARVFAHWRETFNHPRARLDAKRRKLIRARLKDGYSEADLCQSISGYRNSPFHTGQNDRDTAYDGLHVLLRDSDHVDAGLRFYAEPPRTDLSEKTRRAIEQTEGWIPPEVRHAAN